MPPGSLDATAARELMGSRGSADYQLLDVRQPTEYAEARIPGARLIPLPELSQRLTELDVSMPTIVYCRSGARSASAVRFLSGQGFAEVYNLEGGILAWNGHRVAGPVETHLPYLESHSGPEALASLARQMEAGLAAFYTELSGRVESPDTKRLLERLARLEEQHEGAVVELARELGLASDAVTPTRDGGVVEGGLDLVAIAEDNAALIGTRRGVLELAMMIEAHALDLYLRFASSVGDASARRLLHRIADEERSHLALLAEELERLGA